MRSTPAIQQSLWFIVLVSALLASLATSWMLHKPVDYGYEFWYDQMDIRGHIDRYGPKNRYIRGFEDLGREQHLDLFGDIVDAVHAQGDGLAELEFYRQSWPHKTIIEKARNCSSAGRCQPD